MRSALAIAASLLVVGACGSDGETSATIFTSPTIPQTTTTSTTTTTVAPTTSSLVPTTPPPFDAGGILEGSDWELDAYYDGDQVAAVPRGVRDSTIQFDGGVATLDTSCNTGSVDYTAAGDTVTFESLVITEIACDSLSATVEQAIVDTLQGTATVSFAAGVMFIDREEHRLVYLAERRD